MTCALIVSSVVLYKYINNCTIQQGVLVLVLYTVRWSGVAITLRLFASITEFAGA